MRSIRILIFCIHLVVRLKGMLGFVAASSDWCLLVTTGLLRYSQNPIFPVCVTILHCSILFTFVHNPTVSTVLLFIQSHWKQHQWSSWSSTSLETLAWLDVIPLQSLLFTSPYSSALPNKTVFRSSKCSTAKLPSKDVHSVVVTFDWWNGVADQWSCLALARSSELLTTLCPNVVFAWGPHWSHDGSLTLLTGHHV